MKIKEIITENILIPNEWKKRIEKMQVRDTLSRLGASNFLLPDGKFSGDDNDHAITANRIMGLDAGKFVDKRTRVINHEQILKEFCSQTGWIRLIEVGRHRQAIGVQIFEEPTSKQLETLHSLATNTIFWDIIVNKKKINGGGSFDEFLNIIYRIF